MTALVFPIKGAVQFVGSQTGFLTDHLRSDLQWSFDEIGTTNRTVAGTLRGYVVARKRTLTISWDNVPADAAVTVDGYWGGYDMQSFYLNHTGTFTVRVFNRDKGRKYYADSNPEVSLLMRFASFEASVVKRNVSLSPTTITDLWNVSLSLVEI
jgi:hypothetical protein